MQSEKITKYNSYYIFNTKCLLFFLFTPPVSFLSTYPKDTRNLIHKILYIVYKMNLEDILTH
jgi:hypothetical protein